jgi:long-chain acyl-CoA synthetase
MGNNKSRTAYSKYEYFGSTLSGPLINTEVKDYQKDVIDYYKNKSWIEEFMNIQEDYSKNDCMGFRRHLSREVKENGQVVNKFADTFGWYTYDDVLTMSKTLAKNILKYKLTSYQKVEDEGEFHFLGFFSRNMVECLITDLACQLSDTTSVTLYATLGEEAFEFINSQTQFSSICISPDENVDTLIRYHKKYNFPYLKNVILFDLTLIVPEGAEKKLKDAGFNVYFFTDLIKATDDIKYIALTPAKSNSIYTICYTSGTTGLPKGAKISQRNIIAEMNLFGVTKLAYHNETILCYLPLAHIMERINCMYCLFKGSRVGCISGDVKSSLKTDLEILKPTILVAVPRVLNLFRGLILQKLEELPEGCKKSTAMRALQTKRDNFNQSGKITHALYDLLVFKKIRDSFGGNLKVIITASAPLNRETCTDMKIFFSCPIIEAYGMTECCGGFTGSSIYDLENKSCGGCVYPAKYKLVDVPEMNYHSKTQIEGEPSPTGEICMYGPLVFAGYFKNEKVTNETIDEEGWLHTGDIGRIMPEDLGLKIIDRKKEIFKLSQGEYIAPTKLEAVYSKSRFVGQICIHGDSLHDHIIAIIVPNKDSIVNWLKTTGKIGAESKAYYKDSELDKAIKSDLANLAKDSNFNSLEKVNQMILTTTDFTVENGCLTPTMKLVRRAIMETVKDKIKQIYKS